MKWAASVICADQAALGRDVQALEEAGIDALHIDMMDGHAVPVLGMGFEAVRALAAVAHIPLELHVAARDVDDLLPGLLGLPVSVITMQMEWVQDVATVLAEIRGHGKRAGGAVAPGAPWRLVEAILAGADRINLLTVAPGYAGQSIVEGILEETVRRIAAVRRMCPGIEIEVDGHMNEATIPVVARAGADQVVLGTSGLFRPGVSWSGQVRTFRALAARVKESTAASEGKDATRRV